MAKYLITLLTLVAVSGCCTAIDTPIGIPAGPSLLPVTQELWDEIPKHTQKILSDNGLEWEAWYDKVTERIKAHDEALK